MAQGPLGNLRQFGSSNETYSYQPGVKWPIWQLGYDICTAHAISDRPPGSNEQDGLAHRLDSVSGVRSNNSSRGVVISSKKNRAKRKAGLRRRTTLAESRNLKDLWSAFTFVSEDSPVAVAIFDREMNYLWVNPRWASDYKVDRNDVVGRSLYDVFPEIPERWKVIHKNCLAGATESSPEDFFDCDGMRVWLRWKISPWRNDRGDIAGIIILSEDITHQKEVRELVRSTEEKYFGLVHSMADGIILVDDKKRTIGFTNPQAEQMFGYAPGELVGKPLSDLIPDKYKGKHETYHDQYVEDSKPRPMGSGLKITGRRKDGSEIDLDISLSPVRTAQGNFTTAVMRDISLQRNLESETVRILEVERKSREAAEKANRSKDEFLATLSHELRTPLTTILMWAQMMRAGKIDPGKMDQALKSIEQNALTQNQLIGDLLDISRIISGKLTLELKEFDLNTCIRQAIESVQPLAASKSVRIDQILDPAAGTVLADPVRIKQIVWNLLTNAIKFSNQGGVIAVKSEKENGNDLIQVTDHGKGIEPEFLPRIFERFSQEDSTITRKQGGLGLGLSIVHDLVKMHGGSVTAESAGKGKGASFSVRFPRCPDVDIHASSAVSSKDEVVHQREYARLGGMRVLIVDDCIDTREVIQHALESMGAKIQAVESAKTAMEVLPQFRPDVIVSDISMPGEDGYSFIKKVRALSAESGGQTPAIALTAYAGSSDADRCLQAGFQLHLPKPVDWISLGRAVALVASDLRPRPGQTNNTP